MYICQLEYRFSLNFFMYILYAIIIIGLYTIQVKQSNGDYIDVHYHPDAVLVNLGALMQKWTSDVYLATVRSNIVTKSNNISMLVFFTIIFMS